MQRAPTVAYFGYVFALTGYGTAARGYVHALDRAGVPLSVCHLGFRSPRVCQDPVIARHWKQPLPPDLYLWHSEPQEVLRLAPSREMVVLTTWETDMLPAPFVQALDRAAEVWAPSRFNVETFRRQLSVPVFPLPHALPAPVPQRFSRAELNRELGLREDQFVFLAWGSWQERKNLDGVVEAFLRAFPREPDAVLAIKTSFDFTTEAAAREQIARAIARANPPDPESAEARIRVYPLLWPEDVLSSLVERADCVVSLHRGEGWCYPLFEAAAKGKPVVATGYSGPLDYLDPAHHGLVGYRLSSPTGAAESRVRFGFLPGMHWAEADLGDAAEQMRRVYEDREDARRRAETWAPGLRERYSLRAIGEQARARLTRLAGN